MKDSIIVLQIHQDAEVDGEKEYKIENRHVTVDNIKYQIHPFNVMSRGNRQYAILLKGVGFTTINKIGGE